jgi:hypothetical protein
LLGISSNTPIEDFEDDLEQDPQVRERSFLQNYNDLGYWDESYGYTEIKAKIWVDGKRAGSARLTLNFS